MSFLEAIIIAIVEGLTEFLPVSSTGHMIVTASILGIEENDFTKVFEVSVQLGAILAVVVLYWKRFFQRDRLGFYVKLIIGVIPALLFGYLFGGVIYDLLESPMVVAISLLVGGIILLFIDKAFQNPKVESDEQISHVRSFLIGCWQLLAMIPGVSRSAASIIGGMQQKLSRNLAAEFSFFLAVPTMFAASAYSLFVKTWPNNGTAVKGYQLIMQSNQNLLAFVAGNVVAFIVALLAIKFFINYLKAYGFRVFGVYRIIAGIFLLIMMGFGYM